jgi:hypothetical protein
MHDANFWVLVGQVPTEDQGEHRAQIPPMLRVLAQDLRVG